MLLQREIANNSPGVVQVEHRTTRVTILKKKIHTHTHTQRKLLTWTNTEKPESSIMVLHQKHVHESPIFSLLETHSSIGRKRWLVLLEIKMGRNITSGERKQKLNKPKNQPGKMYLSQNTVNAIINYTPEGEKKKKKSQNL